LPKGLLADGDMSDASGLELLHQRGRGLAGYRRKFADLEIIEAKGDGAITALDGDAALSDQGGASEAENEQEDDCCFLCGGHGKSCGGGGKLRRGDYIILTARG
jgi:hypothetical protein